MMTIEEFCKAHNACGDGMKWAMDNCSDMQQVWDTAKPEWLIWVATRPGVLTDKELRLFAVWSARQVQHLMKDQRSIDALDVAERYVNGLATNDELAAAGAAAEAAARAAAAGAADAAAWAADAAAWAAGAAVWAAGAVRAVRAAARAAARANQAKYLRANCNPIFTEPKEGAK